ncbi:hypothetical protein A3G06_00595 [Candidatus Nomurabacteria bacterium RIFCSPLOWO2_12_FULL_46_14]|uniref:Peptidase M50 domain-containing protein n=1 Tax=Candidatus Nomurabacteria bacterium RIFCSPLOWO2_12_FULL_46_14 TaxID=1801797 RepID=A0A1F6Y8N2_9BACT|nr:MAG: hypothetical protein A3G06_00595 [Candidatus Nomurabacteria bacterium RIFCSPLOWO2_12_FULL_46_14]
MDATNGIFYIAILVMSVVIHEISHGFVAEYFGDSTARRAGRLTLNPLPHLDLFGSVIVPLLLIVSHAGFVIGWAKPVPYNPDNLSNRKWGTVAVASAGVLANLLVAAIFGLLIRFSVAYNIAVPEGFAFITSAVVIVNLALAIFNLVPIPPLDGSKILFSLLPASFYNFIAFMEQWALFFIIIFIFYFVDYLSPILLYIFKFLTGLAF